MSRIAFLFLLMSLTLAISGTPAEAKDGPKRYALLVGVNDDPASAAARGVKPLEKPVSDVRAIRNILAEDGRFQTVLLTSMEETTRERIEEEWRALLEKMRPDDVILFYFAGHGLEYRGQSFLRASNTANEITSGESLRTAIDVQMVLGSFADINREGSLAIVILDACREIPAGWQDGVVNNGVGSLRPPPEVFVLYSAGIGQLAWELPDEQHSVFADKLIPHLARTDITLSDMAQLVKRDVIKKISGLGLPLQSPAVYDQLKHPRNLLGARHDPMHYDENALYNKQEKFSAKDSFVECEFCPEMVVIDAGEVVMGSAGGDTHAEPSEKPVRKVKIPRRFAISRYETTVREWNKCAADKDAKLACDGVRTPGEGQRLEHPVTGVSWEDAQQFAKWVTARTGDVYRLPTEAEWEYAARAGTTTEYSFGGGKDFDPKEICNFANGADLSSGLPIDVNLACDDGNPRRPAPVHSYRPNKFGLFDMHGNVWEWVEDCWTESYANVEDGAAWKVAKGPCSSRVARGGSWRSGPAALRSAVRHSFPATHGRSTLGFRLVRDLGKQE
jgi:formylglycine-generating enzyme required for sulfatase activity